MVFGYKKPRIFFSIRGKSYTFVLFCRIQLHHLCSSKNLFIFSHPDYTVGSGIAPDQPLTRVTDFRRLFTACSNHRRSGICCLSITLPRRIPYLILSHYIPLYLIMQDIYLCLFITVNFPYSIAPVHAKAHSTCHFHLPAIPHVFPSG